MRKMNIVNTVCLCSAFLSAASGIPAEGEPIVIRDARVHTMSSAGTIERGSVVISDGKIKAVGPSVQTPAGSRVINGRGLEVYPGMVNAWSNVGLTEVSSISATVDTSEIGEFNPHLLAYWAIHPASEHIPVARVNGITTSLSAPSGGIISGQAVLLHLDGWTVEEMAVRKSAGMVVNFPTLERRTGFRFGGGGGQGPQGQSFAERKREYENRVKELSELLEEARHYDKAMKANPATDFDRKLDALVPVVRGEMTVFLDADSERDIRNAVEFGKKEKLRYVIRGGREANKVTDLLKKENVPVILGSIVALPTREDHPYNARFTLPGDLAKAGIKFALTSPSSAEVRNLPYEAGFAAGYGLSRADALKAVTIWPAEILGVADKLGSLEAGKAADIVVTDGDLLEIRTQVKHLIIAGKAMSLETRHTRLYETYLNRK